MTPTLAETIFFAALPFVVIGFIIWYNIQKEKQEDKQLYNIPKEEKKIYQKMGLM